jgi:alanyl-tRNA synthetase
VEGEPVSRVTGTNTRFQCILNRTPFYAESGGQVGDTGQFHLEAGQQALTVLVTDTQKVGDLIIHDCVYDQGEGLSVGDSLTASVDDVRRHSIKAHHSATHLVHASLKKVLGHEVAQAGSQVGPEGARFDFSFNRGMSTDELNRVEALVNQWVLEGYGGGVESMAIDAAKAAGAVAMFGEKYGDTVRVVSFGGHSMELCGGTHVNHTSEIGLVKLNQEGAVAAGVRRLEFVAGFEAYRQFRQSENTLKSVSLELKARPHELMERVRKLQDDIKQRDKALRLLEVKAVLAMKPSLIEAAAVLAMSSEGTVLVKHLFNETPPEALKTLGEAVMNEAPVPLVLVLGSVNEGKAVILVWVSEPLVKTGINAGSIVKSLAQACGGGGGGKPAFAQAGGKDGHALSAALNDLAI